MSIRNKIRIIQRVNGITADLLAKYSPEKAANVELKKLSGCLDKLQDYLNALDKLKPNYNTNQINQYVVAIDLQLDILSGELEKNDYKRLNRGIKTIKTILKFHPIKYSFFEFIVSWVIELFYFI
jgi:hypothetical protein